MPPLDAIYNHEMMIQLLQILVDKKVISESDRGDLFDRVKAAFEPKSPSE